MSDADKIRELVSKYCAEQRNPVLPKFVIHGPISADEACQLDIARKPGCYVFYGSDGRYHYIGMSLTSVGNRIAAHVAPATQAGPFWRNGSAPYSIDLIEVAEAWEAPSLEAYLYAKIASANSN